MMNRQDKEQLVASLRDRFSSSQAAFLVGMQGMTVAQLQTLRKGVRRLGGDVQVAKNTLLERASDGIAGAQDLKPHFAQQIAVVFAPSDITGIAKAIFDVKRDCEILKVTAGFLDGNLIDAGTIERLAFLPSREQLLAQLCGCLKNAPVRLLWVLKQASEKEQ